MKKLTIKVTREIMQELKKRFLRFTTEMSKASMDVMANLVMHSSILQKVAVANFWEVECVRDGKVIWTEKYRNLVVNVGLDYLLDVALSGGIQIATWYVGLKGAGTVVSGDTMGSHTAWTEDVNYSEGARQTFVDAGVSGQSLDNSASKASFSINASTTIVGCLLTSDNTKGGTSGTLYGAGDFAASRAVISGDTLNVTITCTSAST